MAATGLDTQTYHTKESLSVDKVEELIDPITEQRDEDLVQQVFFEDDAKLILALPVHAQLDDVVAWHYDSKGVFSVRSAYKVQRVHDRRVSRQGAPSSSGGRAQDDVMWKGLWEIKCPGKIKHFLWRMAHNTTAVRVELRRRGMEVDTKCVLCNRLNEDGSHLFFKCKYVIKV